MLTKASDVTVCKGALSSIVDPGLSTSWRPAIEGDWNVSSMNWHPSGNKTTVI
jgi:hypothetical protein